MAEQPETSMNAGDAELHAGEGERLTAGAAADNGSPDANVLQRDDWNLRRRAAQRHGLAEWALRSGHSGWALVRGGTLKVTNRVFDGLERQSVVGPRWLAVQPGGASADPADRGRTLAEAVIHEAQLLLDDRTPLHRTRYCRGHQIIEVTTERSPSAPPEDGLVLANIRDVSDLVSSESRLAVLQESLRQREQASRSGELALELGHDLGNLVGALSARLMVLEAEGVLPRSSLEALQTIAQAQAALVARLKSLARRPEEQPESLSLLADVVNPAVQIVESSLQPPGGRQPVLVRLDGNLIQLPRVMGVRDTLVNVIINLVVNARDAMPEGGVVLITGDSNPSAVLLAIEDQGTGIPAHVLPRIFRPFFSTKRDRGMGMGLSIARQVMRQLGGNITAANRPDGGARFELQFPRMASHINKIESGTWGPGKPDST
jgi:signal transduction histidine kinase